MVIKANWPLLIDIFDTEDGSCNGGNILWPLSEGLNIWSKPFLHRTITSSLLATTEIIRDYVNADQLYFSLKDERKGINRHIN